MNELTTYDMTIRNLHIVKTIFTSQFVINKPHDYSFPSFASTDGSHIPNGRYLIRFDILTNSDLFNLFLFKTEMTKRYESSVGHNLLISELREIRKQASSLFDYYNKELTRENPLVFDILNRERKLVDEENVATIEVLDYEVWTIHFGAGMHSVNREFLHKADYKQYLCDNQTLARYCAKLEVFINSLGLSPDGNFIRS